LVTREGTSIEAFYSFKVASKGQQPYYLRPIHSSKHSKFAYLWCAWP
jgi:hypothetical protein